jgi:hypothetical protein
MIKKPPPCPYSERCQHEKMGLVICHEENCQPIETCYLYTLIKYIDIKKENIDAKRKMPL